MRLKLDENLGSKRVAERLRAGGHDVTTVPEQNLQAAADAQLAHVCRSERRALVTLDLGFADPLHFIPSSYAGIVVIRLPAKPTASDMDVALNTLLLALAEREVGGKLWVVQGRRLREHES